MTEYNTVDHQDYTAAFLCTSCQDGPHTVATPLLGPSEHGTDVMHIFRTGTRDQHVLDVGGDCPCNPEYQVSKTVGDDGNPLGTGPAFLHRVLT